MALVVAWVVISLPVSWSSDLNRHMTTADGVWQCVIALLLIYTLVPASGLVGISLGIVLPVTHTLTAVLSVSSPHKWREVSVFF